MSRILKILFFAVIVRPVVLVILGLNIRNRELLPSKGPAVLAANHNSHLDTLVLMSLYPLLQLHRVCPVEAADYFFANRYVAWFSRNVIGIIPLDRSGTQSRDELFDACVEALSKDQIVILFPEGSRGEAEQMSSIKKGLFHLLKQAPGTRIIPIVMRGLGRALPRGEALLVPFNCDVVIGEAMPEFASADDFVAGMAETYDDLFSYCVTKI